MIEVGLRNLTIQVNRDFKQQFRFFYPIADLTFKSEIRKSVSNELVTAFSIDKDNVNNYLYLGLQGTITSQLNGDLKYDIKQTDSSGFSKTIIKGNINLEQTITQ